jgi:hypothetical protein
VDFATNTEYRGIMLPPQLRLFVRWEQAIAFIVMASFSSLILISPGSAVADDQTSGNSSEGVGIQAASWALTIPYIVTKVRSHSQVPLWEAWDTFSPGETKRPLKLCGQPVSMDTYIIAGTSEGPRAGSFSWQD